MVPSKTLIASLVAASFTLHAPVARAEHWEGDCGFATIRQDTATGQTEEGIAHGYAVYAGGTVQVSCFVIVNGVEAPGSRVTSVPGPRVAAVADLISFDASPTDSVQMCWTITAHGEQKTDCGTNTEAEIPPAELLDTIDDVLWYAEHPDVLLCEVLKAAGVPELVNGTTFATMVRLDPDDCDVWVDDVRRADLMPYGD